jgi:uncharacterized protein YjbI with pentapeptide repeats
MPKCKYFEVCRRDDGADPTDGLCILHSSNPAKDTGAFDDALIAHREKFGEKFKWFVFPGSARFTFKGATFAEVADFSQATFLDEITFWGAMFREGANFGRATFNGEAYLSDAIFDRDADFSSAIFKELAQFAGAKFSGGANFYRTSFLDWANFNGTIFEAPPSFYATDFGPLAEFMGAKFLRGATFTGPIFKGSANFRDSIFNGKTSITALDVPIIAGPGIAPVASAPDHYEIELDRPPAILSVKSTFRPVFIGADVDFRNVTISEGSIIFDRVDLQKCRLCGTDLKNAELTAVTWTSIDTCCGRRVGIYDEVARAEIGEDRPWEQIEQVYRRLKQNFEDRSAVERAGDFHYGEKEARRMNPNTPAGLRLLLTFYCWIAGYGERLLRPIFSAALLLLIFSFTCIYSGLIRKGEVYPLSPTRLGDWLSAAWYTAQLAVTQTKPANPTPIGDATIVNIVQRASAILFGGLFAIFCYTIKQKLKR